MFLINEKLIKYKQINIMKNEIILFILNNEYSTFIREQTIFINALFEIINNSRIHWGLEVILDI